MITHLVSFWFFFVFFFFCLSPQGPIFTESEAFLSYTEAAYPSPLLIATGEAIPLRGLEGVPGLPGEIGRAHV